MTREPEVLINAFSAQLNAALAENAELRSEVARLRGIEQFAAEASRHERDGLRAEVARLRVLIAIRKCAEHALEHKP